MTLRAARAIIEERLRGERRTLFYWCAAALVVGFIQPHGIVRTEDPFAADLAIRSVWLAGPMFFCAVLGIAIALLQGPGRSRVLDIAEFSAPLFGRELARAKAAAAGILIAVPMLCYWLAQWIAAFPTPPTFFMLAVAAVFASTLVALNATLRAGPARALYIVMAFATAAFAYIIGVYADTLPPKRLELGHYEDAFGVAVELVFCAIVGLVALRQYGEALARYNPESL